MFDVIKPKRKMVRHEEIHVQRPIIEVLKALEAYTKQLTFFHVPNQLLRRQALKMVFAALGVRSGVPDLVICLTGGRVLFVELKYGKNKTSDKQDGFIATLGILGHLVEVIAAEDGPSAIKQLYAILIKHGVKI